MSNSSAVLRITLALSLLAVLAGCATAPSTGAAAPESVAPSDSRSPSESPSASPDASTVPSGEGSIEELPDGDFASVGQLRAALEGVGVDCADWVQDDAVIGATGSGWCSDQWGLAVFPGVEERNALLTLSDDSVEAQPFLVDGNWTVTRGYGDPADLEPVRAEFGGEIWYPGDPLPN